MENKFENEDIEKNHDIAAFAWTLFFAPILLIMRRDSQFIKFNARQAAILFVFAVIIFSLPRPLSHLNIFTLVIAITGFLNANLGRWWKAPILFDLVEKGLTPSEIAIWVKNFIFNFLSIIKRIFTKGPGFAMRGTANAIAKVRGIDNLNINSKVEKLTQENDFLKEQVNFLEIEFIIEKFLRGEIAEHLAEETKDKIKKIRKLFIKKDIIEKDASDFLYFEHMNKKIIFGNFDQSGFLIFTNFTIKNEEFDIYFGRWNAMGVMFSQLNKNLKKIEKIAKRFLDNKNV